MAKDDDKPARRRCAARTAGGKRCRRTVEDGSTTCWSHSFVVPGRPTKLTPEIQGLILNAVLEGNYLETAAQAAGINKTTLYRWLRRGDDLEAVALEHIDDQAADLADVYSLTDPAGWIYLDFRHALKSAEAYSEIELLRRTLGGELGWQAPMTVLERRHPTHWRRRDSHHVELENTETAATVETVVPPEDRRQEVAALLAAAGALNPPTENTTTEEDPKHENHD